MVSSNFHISHILKNDIDPLVSITLCCTDNEKICLHTNCDGNCHTCKSCQCAIDITGTLLCSIEEKKEVDEYINYRIKCLSRSLFIHQYFYSETKFIRMTLNKIHELQGTTLRSEISETELCGTNKFYDKLRKLKSYFQSKCENPTDKDIEELYKKNRTKLMKEVVEYYNNLKEKYKDKINEEKEE